MPYALKAADYENGVDRWDGQDELSGVMFEETTDVGFAPEVIRMSQLCGNSLIRMGTWFSA